MLTLTVRCDIRKKGNGKMGDAPIVNNLNTIILNNSFISFPEIL